MSRNIIKNALVTGAAKRLGREIAIALAKDGWNVAVHYNSTAPDDVVDELKKYGVKAVAIRADLLNFSDVENLLPQATRQLGEITLLVNSASIFEKVKFDAATENDFDTNLDIHIKTPFFLAQQLLKLSAEGQIINIIDSFVVRGTGSYFPYLLAKKSLRSLSAMLAVEMAPRFRVNSIFPGSMEDMTQKDQNYLKARIEQVPMKKFSNSNDVCKALIFLANSNLTGQEIFVDGGEQLI